MAAIPLIPRQMREEDLSWVMAVELESYPFPWTEGIFHDCIHVGYQCQIFDLDQEPVGYAIFSIAAGEAHILNLCVKPLVQRQGIGRSILQFVIQAATLQRAENLFLEVRQSNRVAIQLYDAMGFHQLGVRVGYYPTTKGNEDAIVMAKALFLSS